METKSKLITLRAYNSTRCTCSACHLCDSLQNPSKLTVRPWNTIQSKSLKGIWTCVWGFLRIWWDFVEFICVSSPLELSTLDFDHLSKWCLCMMTASTTTLWWYFGFHMIAIMAFPWWMMVWLKGFVTLRKSSLIYYTTEGNNVTLFGFP